MNGRKLESRRSLITVLRTAKFSKTEKKIRLEILSVSDRWISSSNLALVTSIAHPNRTPEGQAVSQFLHTKQSEICSIREFEMPISPFA